MEKFDSTGYILNLFSIHEKPDGLDLDVLFSPPVNYHKTSMSELKKVASTANSNLNAFSFNTNYLEIIPYTFAKETDTKSHDIESVYTLYTKGNYDCNTITYHKKAVFIGKDKSSDKFENLIKILEVFKGSTLDNIEELMEVNTILEMDMDITSEDDFATKYIEFKQQFQEKYKIFFAYIEGVHRSTLFAKFAEKSPISNCINDTEYNESVFENKRLLSSPYHVRLYLFPPSKMPSIEDLKERSLVIRKNQDTGFKFTLTNVASNCKEIFLENQQELNIFEESKWITQTDPKKDEYLKNRHYLIPLYLKNLLQKGPIAEKCNYNEKDLRNLADAVIDKLKFGFFIPPSSILSKTNPGKQWPREAKIFCDLLSLASFNSTYMGKFHLMLEGITSEISQNKTLLSSVNFNDFKFYEELLLCVRISAEYYYQHHMWHMHVRKPGKSSHSSIS